MFLSGCYKLSANLNIIPCSGYKYMESIYSYIPVNRVLYFTLKIAKQFLLISS